MYFEAGEILLIKDFEFSRKGTLLKKDKYMIPLVEATGKVLLVSLPSSQVYISKENTKAGCINISELGISIYHFPANKIIGKDGFQFPKDTFLYLRQLFETTDQKLLKYNVSNQLLRLDRLQDEKLKDLLYCAFKSDQVAEKYKPKLEKKLTALYENE